MNEYKENSFRETINKLEPADGAKERMLQNIRRKAAAQQNPEMLKQTGTKTPEMPPETAVSKAFPILRILKWSLPAAACIAVAALAIRFIPKPDATPNDHEGNVMVGNPFGEELSAEELTKQLGICIDIPDDSENVTYHILDGDIANIDFEYRQKSYTLRASKKTGDFSGVNGTVIKYDKMDASNDAVLETIRGDKNYYKLTWTDGTITYILVNNSEISTGDITELYELIK